MKKGFGVEKFWIKRVISLMLVALMLASTIQIDFDFESVAALPDSTVALGPNLASQVNEGTASASDDDGANLPGNANDNNTATYWLTTVSPTLPVTYEISWSGNGSLTFNSILILERYSGVALGMGNYGIEYWDGANWISVSNLSSTSSDYALPGTDEWGNCDFTSDARCEHLIQFDPVTAEKVRISVTSFATDGITTATRISFYEFMVFNNYSLASDATATADLEDGTDVASNAIDNDEDTWWQSTSSSTWLEVAWASTKEISSVEIVSGTVMAPPRNRVPADFDVEYWDGANWVSALAAAVSVNTSPDVTLLFTDTIKTTKLRLMITAVTSQPPRIREFRIFPPGPPGNIPTFGASPTQIQTGGQTSTISAELRDEDGNLVLDGTSVTFEEINGLCDAGFGGYPPSSNQEVGTTIDGVAQVTLFSGDVDCLSGPPDDRAQIRVSTWDATLGTTQRVDARVEILADLGIYFTVELYTWSAGTWTQLSSGDTVRAGRDIGVLVQAFDQFGNPKTDYTGTVTFSTNASNSPNTVDVLNPNTPPMLPPNAALTNGRFEWARNDNAPFDQVPADTNCTDAFNPATNDCFALYNAESGVTLTATDTLDPTIDGTSVDIEILSRPPSDLNNDLILEVPGSAVLGFSFSVTVTAVDRYGNTVKDYVYVGGTRGEVTFSSNDPFPATLPANYQFQAVDNGTKQFTVTMKSVGTWWLQVEDNIIPGVSPRPYWDQEDIDVSATSNITLSCLASPSQIPADGASQSTITANAQMGGSDVPNGTTINFEILPDALGTSLSSSEAITTGGNASVTLTSGLTIGTVTVRVFYDENFDDTWDATEPNATCDVNLYRGDETEFCAVGYGNVQGTIFWDRNRNGEFDPTIDVILQSEPFTDNNGNGVYDEGIDGFDPATQDVGFDGLPDSLTVDVYMPGNGVPPYFPFDYAEGNGKHDSVDIYIEDSTTPNAHATALGYSVSVPAGYTNGSDMGGYSYITVKAPGFYHQVKNIFVPLNGSVTLDFGLILFDAITGKVTKSDGFPAEGVMITVIDSSGRQLTASEDQIDGLVAGIPGGYVLPVVVTDAFGNYVVKGLHDDTYKVMADNNEFMASTKSGIVVEYDETAVVNFENMSYCFGVIHGYVWESAVGTWRAAGGVEVSIPGLGLSTITDGSGQWLINNIPPGEYWVIAKKQGFTIGVQRVDVTECCDTAPIQPGDFWLEELEYCGDVACDNATVEGIVTDELGRPIEDAVVRFPGLEVTDFLRVPFPMRTDKAGYYIFTKYTDLKPQGAPGYDPDPWVSDSYYTYDSDGIPPGCYWIVVSDEVCQFTDPYDW
ncbi:MAG: discoidin domain-containing protein, partial [Candidatus Methanofastidiosia archaeon]